MTADVLPGDTPSVNAHEPGVAYRKYRRLVPWAVGISIATLVTLSVYYQSRHGSDVVAELRRLSVWTIPAAIGLHLLMQACWGLRIKVLGDALGAPVRYGRAVTLVTSGLFAAAVTPGRVGGEPWRIAMLVRGGASGAAASQTILADRAVDMLFFLSLGTIAVLVLPLLFGDTGNVQALGLLAVVGLAAMVALVVLILVRPQPVSRACSALANIPARMRGRPVRDHAPAIAAFFREVTGGLRQLVRQRPASLAAAAVLSVALWTCELSILWVVLKGFGFAAPYDAVYLAGVLVVMIASVPALPGGTGLAEVAALTLLTPLAPGLTPAFLVVWRGLTYYVDLSLGAVVAGLVVRRRPSVPSAPTT
ncbi:MAG: lysylphosphatidylglycerol synthase transmembrane domain-containing protein [Candidatus Thermoplasmatota archaeon]